DVHGGHGQARAVDHAGDVTVELDVVQAVLGGFYFERIFLIEVAKLPKFFVAEQAVIVEGHFGVEGYQAAVSGDHARIDFEERGVGVDECAVQGLKKWHGFGGGFAGEAETESQLPRLIRLQAGSRMDVFTQDSFGMGLGDFFDFHAACGAGHEHHFAGGAIDKDAEVKFALDVHALFDQQAFDDTPCGTRLHGDQIHAQHVTGDVCRFLRGTRELYTAALAAATRVDLRLHDNNVG